MTEHPEQLLSAYLDEALEPAERSSVGTHVEGCAQCRSRLAELRATSRLLAALPELVPTRALRPRLQRGWLWLRPVRLLGSIGSGAFLFLFLASYVINSGSSLGGGTSQSETLAAQGKFSAAASAAAAENAQKTIGTPAPPAAPAARTTTSNADTARSAAGPSASPPGVAFGVGTTQESPAARPVGPPPASFLVVAVLFAMVAFIAHRRLRRSPD